MNKSEVLALSQIRSLRLQNELKTETLLTQLRQDALFAAAENARDILRFKVAKLRYQNADLGNLNEELELAEKKIKDRLNQLGYSPDDLITAYACTLCNDTGFINQKQCKCVKALAYKMLKDNCKTLATDIDDFEVLNYSIIPPQDKDNYRISASILAKFEEKFPDNKYGIIMLCGKQGTGKTYLMSILANAVMKKCASVVFYNAIQLNEIFLKYHLARIEDKEDIFTPITEADFLVIDDLGAENLINNVTETYLYELLVLRESKFTGITTNMYPSQLLNRYGHRIASRLCAKDTSYIINFDGEDLRFIKK